MYLPVVPLPTGENEERSASFSLRVYHRFVFLSSIFRKIFLRHENFFSESNSSQCTNLWNSRGNYYSRAPSKGFTTPLCSLALLFFVDFYVVICGTRRFFVISNNLRLFAWTFFYCLLIFTKNSSQKSSKWIYTNSTSCGIILLARTVMGQYTVRVT